MCGSRRLGFDSKAVCHILLVAFCILCLLQGHSVPVSLVFPLPTHVLFFPLLLIPTIKSFPFNPTKRSRSVVISSVSLSEPGCQTVFAAFCRKSAYSGTINSPALHVLIRVHIIAQRANRYIVAFCIAISRYHSIFAYQVTVVKLKDFRPPAVM